MVISSTFSSNLQCTLRKNVPFSFSVKPLRYDELINLIIACYRKMHSIGHSCSQGNSLCLLCALGNKFAVFSQVYSTEVQVSLPTFLSYSDAAKFLYYPPLAFCNLLTSPSLGIRWLLCEFKFVIFSSFRFPRGIWHRGTSFFLPTNHTLRIWIVVWGDIISFCPCRCEQELCVSVWSTTAETVTYRSLSLAHRVCILSLLSCFRRAGIL